MNGISKYHNLINQTSSNNSPIQQTNSQATKVLDDHQIIDLSKSSHSNSQNHWTIEKDTFIKDTYLKYDAAKCTELFNSTFEESVSVNLLKKRARILGLTGKKHVRWTPEMFDFLKKTNPTSTPAECTKLFNETFNTCVSETNIRKKRSSLKKESVQVKSSQHLILPNNRWTIKEDSFLKETYPKSTAAECTKLFNDTFKKSLTENAVKKRCRVLGLTGKKCVRWTPEMTDFLKKTYPNHSFENCVFILNQKFKSHFSEETIKVRCRKLGIKRINPSVDALNDFHPALRYSPLIETTSPKAQLSNEIDENQESCTTESAQNLPDDLLQIHLKLIEAYNSGANIFST